MSVTLAATAASSSSSPAGNSAGNNNGAKGDKVKKFQSLNINNLYQVRSGKIAEEASCNFQ